MNKDTFCILPFTGIFLGPDGNIKPCCSNITSWGNLHKNDINSILQSNQARSLRNDIVQGKWNPSCKQCKNQEEQGIKSERTGSLDNIPSDIDMNFFNLERLDLRWSNTCNLACTYCYEYFSSKWAQIKGIKVNTLKDENENSLFLLIEQQLQSINSVLLLGGEPLLQKENIRLIDILGEHGISILTNLAVDLKTNQLAQKLIDRPNVSWSVSFETIGDRYEYVRHNASWKLFKENIEYLHSKVERKLEAHSLYSIYSAFNLVEFYEFITENNFTEVHWHLLESSGASSSASVINLNSTLKNKAILEIEQCQAMYPTAPGIDQLNEIKNLFKKTTPDYSSEFIKEISLVEKQLSKEVLFRDLWPDVYKDLEC